MKHLLRLDEAAELLSVSARTVRRLIDEGRLIAMRLSTGNSPIRIPSEEVEAYIEAQKKAFDPKTSDNA